MVQVWSSPMRRALQTAQLIAHGLGLQEWRCHGGLYEFRAQIPNVRNVTICDDPTLPGVRCEHFDAAGAPDRRHWSGVSETEADLRRRAQDLREWLETTAAAAAESIAVDSAGTLCYHGGFAGVSIELASFYNCRLTREGADCLRKRSGDSGRGGTPDPARLPHPAACRRERRRISIRVCHDALLIHKNTGKVAKGISPPPYTAGCHFWSRCPKFKIAKGGFAELSFEGPGRGYRLSASAGPK